MSRPIFRNSCIIPAFRYRGTPVTPKCKKEVIDRRVGKIMAKNSRAAGLGDDPRRTFDELGEISLVDVVLPTRQKKVEIRRRCIFRPTDHQAILLDRLGLRLPRQPKVEPKM